MIFNANNVTRMFAVVVLMMGAAMLAAHVSDARADDDENEGQMPTVSNAMWKDECGACHYAFPPGMLPVESWRAVMSGLGKHFGSDASLDDATANEITNFLVKNAGTKKNGTAGKPLLRITETRWFKSEHREVADRTWKNPKVKSPANCTVCHTRAESGDFGERSLKIPK